MNWARLSVLVRTANRVAGPVLSMTGRGIDRTRAIVAFRAAYPIPAASMRAARRANTPAAVTAEASAGMMAAISCAWVGGGGFGCWACCGGAGVGAATAHRRLRYLKRRCQTRRPVPSAQRDAGSVAAF